jgi:thiol:disulfide interchange protein
LVICALWLLGAEETHAQSVTQAAPTLYVNEGYRPDADPDADLALAVRRAAAENKHILVVVGGDWCVWCHVLDRFLARDQEVHAAFAAAFVILKVNWSRENENAEFLSRYPESTAYPDFFILDAHGQFLAQQQTDVLERDRSYDRAQMIEFALLWRPT